MKYIEQVSTHEVVWRLLKGHFGDEIKFVQNILREHTDALEAETFNNHWKDNMIRLGALALCAGTDCPVTDLILRKSPKSSWNTGLKFSRYHINIEDFINFKEINYDKKLYKAINKYKNDKMVLSMISSIRNNTFDFSALSGIILYKIGSDYTVIDGVHRSMAVMSEIYNNNLVFPYIDVICLDNKIEIKRKTFIYRKQYVIK